MVKRLISALVALLLLGMGSAAVLAQALPPRAETLHVAIESANSTMDPQRQGNMTDMGTLINMFDMLLFRDHDLNLVPWLATEWHAVDDYTWQFKLREGVEFHNGEPFNAAAVKFSIERLLDPEVASPIVELRYVERVDIVDEYTVNIRTEEPDPLIPAKLTMFGGVMVPPEYIKEHGNEHFAQNPVGTGPYKFVEWVRGGRVVMEANENYWGGAPEVKYLVFHPIPDDASRVASLQAGEIDVVSNLAPDVYDLINRSPGVRAVSAGGLRAHYLSVDTRTGPLADKRVRQAINYAIDIDGLVELVLGGHGTRINTIIPQPMFGHHEGIPGYPYDPAKARELLAEAGYASGFPLKIHATSGSYMKDRDVALAIGGMLSDVGIDAEVEILETGTFREFLLADKLAPLFYIGNLAWTLDGANNFQSYVASDRRYSRIRDPRLDELVIIEETSMDPEVRRDAFYKAQEILHEEAYFVPLWTGNDIYGLSNRVDWTPRRNSLIWLADAKIK